MVLPLVIFHPISQVVNAAAQLICPFAEDSSPRRQATYLPSVRQGIADCVIKWWSICQRRRDQYHRSDRCKSLCPLYPSIGCD